VVTYLRDSVLSSTTLPAPQMPGVTLDGPAIATELRTLASDLSAALGDVARETREAQATLVAKQRALSAYDASFTGVASVVASLLTLTDQPELAARVRPSRHRPGRTAESTDDASDAGEASDAEPVAAAS